MYSLLHILLFSSFSASAEQVPSRDISFLSGKKGFLDLIIIGRRLLCAFALTGSGSNAGLLEIKYVALTAVPRKILRRDKKVDSRVSVIFDVVSPTHGRVPIDPLIDFPKDLSSKMSLEVAQRRLDIGDISADLPMEILQFLTCFFP